MIPHAVSILGVFVDTLAQAPVVLQCTQAAPEPWWKWWMQNVLPVSGGTLIAVWSFVQSRKSEHAQWIRDQRKAEWKGLLSEIAAVEKEITRWIDGQVTGEGLEKIVQNSLASLRDTLFIYPAIADKSIGKWVEFTLLILEPSVSHPKVKGKYFLLLREFRELARKDLGLGG